MVEIIMKIHVTMMSLPSGLISYSQQTAMWTRQLFDVVVRESSSIVLLTYECYRGF